MNNYERFQKNLKEQKKQSYLELKAELKSIKVRLDKFLTAALESSSNKVERDFKIKSF